jgi:hypothetical protein
MNLPNAAFFIQQKQSRRKATKSTKATKATKATRHFEREVLLRGEASLFIEFRNERCSLQAIRAKRFHFVRKT